MPTQGKLTTRTSSALNCSALLWSQEKTRMRGLPFAAAQGARICSRNAPIVRCGSSMPGCRGPERLKGMEVGQDPAQMPQDVHWLALTRGSAS